jgi:hypothetical protein
VTDGLIDQEAECDQPQALCGLSQLPDVGQRNTPRTRRRA